ncbi:MAG: helix-turn-helix domain-containing protein [Chloroflexi bacterium]|nr:helix-turn-helix domain-containing protein [Chloroflexota bacterium]
MPTNRLLTVTETAHVLSVSRSKLYELVLAGDIPSITLGRSRRIPAAALAEWIAHQQVDQAPPAPSIPPWDRTHRRRS